MPVASTSQAGPRREPVVPVEADHRFARLYDYWDDRRAGRTMPSRRDLDPIDIPRLLPHLFLVDVGADAETLSYRLMGTEVGRLFGSDLTGRAVGSGLRPAAADRWRALHLATARSARPVFVNGPPLAGTVDTGPRHLLLLPLSNDDRRVNMLIGMAIGVEYADLARPTFGVRG